MKNKGITLIALIVTVIIMVILASVSINLITNGGIIDKTRTASKDYQYEADKEEWLLAVTGSTDFFTGEIDLEELEKTLDGWDINLEENIVKAISPNDNEFKSDLQSEKETEKPEEPEEEKISFADIELGKSYDIYLKNSSNSEEILSNDITIILQELEEDNELKVFSMSSNEIITKNYLQFGIVNPVPVISEDTPLYLYIQEGAEALGENRTEGWYISLDGANISKVTDTSKKVYTITEADRTFSEDEAKLLDEFLKCVEK